ncbi:hypothetical protein GCM10010245_90710 [Streptomyces spectabilis]|uniref:DNA-binding CsgD family transcriptional regulator n=1 Tax=Streptomyces spectabilis TaxID=68270 RepID=A0A7W8B4I8_STRST|nr:DNA-binding CsgD family transcriptional regulator [Streptomyces spectabilis]GGV57585.1 hypothetical protein GCM10010245_90710 [Streptomyces spectabilis]
MGQLKSQAKPFDISKWEVKEAWEEVRANRGAPGVDGQGIADFEKNLRNNLYKVWNRISLGSYFSPPVRAVVIPEPNGGGEITLGIPAVADRVAQTVVARHLMRRVEPVFHPDSGPFPSWRCWPRVGLFCATTKLLVDGFSTQITRVRQELRVLVYPSSIDLSSRTLRFVSKQLTARRRETGTRWRRLSAARQALLVLARRGDTYAQLAAGLGIGIATVYRYIREAVEALSALAPSLAEAMRTIKAKAFVNTTRARIRCLGERAMATLKG